MIIQTENKLVNINLIRQSVETSISAANKQASKVDQTKISPRPEKRPKTAQPKSRQKQRLNSSKSNTQLKKNSSRQQILAQNSKS